MGTFVRFHKNFIYEFVFIIRLYAYGMWNYVNINFGTSGSTYVQSLTKNPYAFVIVTTIALSY